MEGKYLPIGTVVLIKDGTKKVMITSYLITTVGENPKIFDYGGCPFPEGIVETDYSVGFNHDQIAQIVYMGLVDDEQKQFNELLLQSTEEIHQQFEEESSAA